MSVWKILAHPTELRGISSVNRLGRKFGENTPTDSQGFLPTRPKLSAQRVRELLRYDPETGALRWRIKPCRRIVIGADAGCRTSNGRLQLKLDGHTCYGHTLAVVCMTGEWPTGDVLARNGDRTDLRWSNLYQSRRSETAIRTRRVGRNNTSGAKGVSWVRGASKWRADIRADGRTRCLGFFDIFAEAVAARKAGESKYFGSGFQPTPS